MIFQFYQFFQRCDEFYSLLKTLEKLYNKYLNSDPNQLVIYQIKKL